ncbi:MAG: DUF3365 domain-containing protein [Elainellaceae cyanobacterium]
MSLNSQAEQAVKERAEIFLTAMQAARNYTRDNIQPLLDQNADFADSFIQESIPNFAARTVLADFQHQNPDFQSFFYKEAALNPTNPSDQSDRFEARIISQLKQRDAADPQEISGYRPVEGENLFYLARPLMMTDISCLDCHGDPRNAPEALIKMYGDQNGFGWKLNDMVAAQMVYVPADRVFDRGRENLFTVTQTLLSSFAALFVAVNLLLWKTVVKPLKILTDTAKRISSCSIDQAQNTVPPQGLKPLTVRRDESGQLARAFEYMLHVLSRREQDLQTAVRLGTQSLKEEMRERQAAQDALQTYAHAINHDLRNLVMGISSLVQGTLFRTAKSLRPGHATDQPIQIEPTALTLIQSSCDRQLKLMNSLMEVQSSDVWRLALQPQPINLRALTEDLEAACAAKLSASSATLENHIPASLPLVHADKSQLQRVFENLIDNAMKHNPQGVTIGLSAAPTQDAPSMIRCTVYDSGVGVNLKTSQDLFKIYTRDRDRLKRDTSGYGLGLYICRKIVEAHGGDIGVKASCWCGAAFWFTLPLHPPPGDPNAAFAPK